MCLGDINLGHLLQPSVENLVPVRTKAALQRHLLWQLQGTRGGPVLGSELSPAHCFLHPAHSCCSYLGFWHNGIAAGSVTKESWKWWWNDDWVRTNKPTEITAGNGVLLCLHHKCVHGIEAVPWQPHCPLLAHERGPFKVQRQGGSTICNQVKPRKVWPLEVTRLSNSSNHIPG